MLPILTSAIVLIGILVLMSKGGLPSGGRSRLVLHYPASGPSPVALIELTEASVILDRRLAELWQRRASLTDVAERALLAQIEALGTTDLRVGDSAGSTFTPPRPQMLPLSIKVKSPEYAAMVKAVEDRGVTDAPVVAEALLAAVHKPAVPLLATVDHELPQRLSTPDDPYRAAQPEQVTFHGRALRIRVVA
jgi:hypothetical protein